MTLNDLTHGEPWMDPEERQTAAELVQAIQQSLTDRQIPETPFLVLRVQDYLLHHTLCRRLERSLTPDPGATPPVTVLPSLAEHIGKSRDRLRKSLKDLDDAASKLAQQPPPPPPPARPFNLPDFYKPILEEVGVDLINDPDFFADEDNFYDVPPYRHPTNPDPSKPTPEELSDQSLSSGIDSASNQSTPSDQPNPAQDPKAPSSLSTVNCQLSTALPPITMPCIVPTRKSPPAPPKPHTFVPPPPPLHQHRNPQ